MQTDSYGVLNEENRSNWVRLQTLITLRWIAIVGQLSAIFVAQWLFNLNLDLPFCLMAIGASVVANLLAISIYPKNKRLSEREVALMLVFDLTQLSVLLALTGGLHNPFALLLLAPVTISASTLRTAPTILVGLVAIVFSTLVLWFHIPLTTDLGLIMLMPSELLFGFWAAIVIGVVFLGAYARRVTSEINSMSEALLATQLALSREQKITDLAGVVAAAAHELGTPLATIKLTSSELMEELSGKPELLDDAKLIRDQADRCRDILQSMGRAGKDDLHLHHIPLEAVIREAAEPHTNRGKDIFISAESSDQKSLPQPDIYRRPEIIHGIRNLIQNAVDFSFTTVWVDAVWNADSVSITITDDGRGFPPHLIGRIGDPFVRSRRPEQEDQRPEYRGMGLGLFIAKTLLERSGATLSFKNGHVQPHDSAIDTPRIGAIVDVSWPRAKITPAQDEVEMARGENQKIQF